jgi:UDP-GlcNAc:undecaprenyl-phosphate/decaprenyl-phosphate GlcNAc-1-phosphate transferase
MFDIFSDISSIWVHVLGFTMALTICGILTPIIRKYALQRGFYDVPNDRKIHTSPIPRLGGIAIWLGFMLTMAWFSYIYKGQFEDEALVGTLLGGSLMFFVGLIDDLYNLSPYLKLFGQFLAATTAFHLGVQISALDLPYSQILLLQDFSYPVTVLWLIALSNAMNFIDGVDGLAGGVSMISALTMSVVALNMHEPVPALFAIILAGSTLGFLNFNFYPARIFMGDSGALFCGFVLASIAVTGVLKTLTMTMLLPVVILTVPILDITYSVLRRLWRFQNPFEADADHLHHKLLKLGFSQIRTTIAFYVLCIIGGIISCIYIGHLNEYLLALGAVILFSSLLVIATRYFSAKNERRIDLTQPPPIKEVNGIH